ncbi:uncharacterized protein At1g32220, chloroplastic [Morus notabilis]|nr:uncharacterized protein At1g32220, chloroplastic [Morus notabilis]
MAASNSDKHFEVEEAETVNVPPPAEKLLVLGGNGFIGSHICKEAVDRGLSVASVSRSGRSSIKDSWASNVTWHQGDLLSPGSWEDALNGVTSVISCVGGLGPNSHMYEINGTANINAIRAASEKGVKRFVYISSASAIKEKGIKKKGTHLFSPLFRGYYEGKRATQVELLTKFPHGGVILGPGFVYGTRRIGSIKLPLGVIGYPVETVLQCAKPLRKLPLVGPLFNPPINVTFVAKAALRAATDPAFPPGAVDLDEIQRYSKEKF